MKRFFELKKGDLIWITFSSYNKESASYWWHNPEEPWFIENRDFILVQVTYIEEYKSGLRIAVKSDRFQHTIYVPDKYASSSDFYIRYPYFEDSINDRQLITELYPFK